MRNSKSNLYIPYIPLTCNSKKKNGFSPNRIYSWHIKSLNVPITSCLILIYRWWLNFDLKNSSRFIRDTSSLSRVSPFLWSVRSHFSPQVRPSTKHVGVGLMNRTIYRGKFSESSVEVPIAAVAGNNDQSPLLLVRQVGASRDLSEATRRGAVRALWGTVTHT